VHARPVPPQAESRSLPSVGMTNLVGTAEASEFTVRVAVESAVALILWLESLPLPCCRLLLFTAVVASAALPLYAQDYPRGDAFGGYQRTSFPDGTLTTVSGDGWNTGGAFYFSQWLGVKGEFSGTYATDSTVPKARSVHNYTYTFGPVITVRSYHRVNPFAEVLFGSYHETIKGSPVSNNGFALLAGGGADINLNFRFALRIGPFDLQHLQAPGNVLRWKADSVRYGGGIVVHF